MSIFKKVDGSENRYLRMGLYGKAGSGKTRTAMEVAIGLALDQGGGPIYMVDTEGNGVDHMRPVCEAAGVELYGAKTRDLKIVLQALEAAERAGAVVVIVDSVSHIWTELMERFYREAKSGKKYIDMQDWGPIKSAWRLFPDAYLAVQCHAIVCGRSGGVYEDVINDRTGKRESVKVDTKMRAEAEMEHEPSLLLEMTLEPKRDGQGRRTGYVNVGTVLKDRYDRINGKRIEMPTYADFAPVVRMLAPDGKHVALHQSESTGVLFGSPDWDLYRDRRRIEELKERMKGVLDLHGLSGTAGPVKKRRAELMLEHFGSPSFYEAASRLRVDQLEDGMKTFERALMPQDPVDTDNADWLDPAMDEGE